MTMTYVRELTLKYRAKKGVTCDRALTPKEAARLMRKVLPDNVREHFVALMIDASGQLVGYYVVATGTASSCPVTARELFQAAVVSGACSLLVGHNHPSGNHVPSAEDRAVTRRLKEAGALLGIPVVDHVVIGGEGYCSSLERGEL